LRLSQNGIRLLTEGSRNPDSGDVVFVAWSKLSLRTKLLANEIGAHLVFVRGGPPYLKNWLETKKVLKSMKPHVVLVQLPQGPLLFAVLKIAKQLGFHVVADTHTGFVYTASITEKVLNKPFQKNASSMRLGVSA